MSVYRIPSGDWLHHRCHWEAWVAETAAEHPNASALGIETIRRDPTGMPEACARCGEPLDFFNQPLAWKLERTRVIWRAPETAHLYAVPYEMAAGQSPYDIYRARRDLLGCCAIPEDWTWLPEHGHSRMAAADLALVTKFLTKHKDKIPQNVCEWSAINEKE